MASCRDEDVHTDVDGPQTLTRRAAVQSVLGAGVLLTIGSVLPRTWNTPLIVVGTLPAHAQTSGATGGDNGTTSNTGGDNTSGDNTDGGSGSGGEPADDDAGPGTMDGTSQWSLTKTVEADPCGHHLYIGLGPVLTVKITGTTIELRATGMPTLTGTIDATGTFSASGVGTVAGVANVTTSMEGSLLGSTFEATLSLGEGGELPLGNCQQAMPITYSLVGTKS